MNLGSWRSVLASFERPSKRGSDDEISEQERNHEGQLIAACHRPRNVHVEKKVDPPTDR